MAKTKTFQTELTTSRAIQVINNRAAALCYALLHCAISSSSMTVMRTSAAVRRLRCNEFVFITLPNIVNSTFIHNAGLEDHGAFVNATVWRARSCNGTCACTAMTVDSSSTAGSAETDACESVRVEWTYSHLRDELLIESLNCIASSPLPEESNKNESQHGTLARSVKHAEVMTAVYPLTTQRARLEPLVQRPTAFHSNDIGGASSSIENLQNAYTSQIVDDVVDNLHIAIGQYIIRLLFHSSI